jgi:hypothetical protein
MVGSVEELEQVLERLENYQTVIPEAAVENILSKAGLATPDPQESHQNRFVFFKQWSSWSTLNILNYAYPLAVQRIYTFFIHFVFGFGSVSCVIQH